MITTLKIKLQKALIYFLHPKNSETKSPYCLFSTLMASVIISNIARGSTCITSPRKINN